MLRGCTFKLKHLEHHWRYSPIKGNLFVILVCFTVLKVLNNVSLFPKILSVESVLQGSESPCDQGGKKKLSPSIFTTNSLRIIGKAKFWLTTEERQSLNTVYLYIIFPPLYSPSFSPSSAPPPIHFCHPWVLLAPCWSLGNQWSGEATRLFSKALIPSLLPLTLFLFFPPSFLLSPPPCMQKGGHRTLTFGQKIHQPL